MRTFLGSRVFVAFVASTLTAVVVGGIAWAVQSPVDGNGTIHACFNPSTGAVKLQVSTTCPTTGASTPITWNAQGQQGAQGDVGPQGPPGPIGPASVASLRTIELLPAVVPETDAFVYPDPVDVHDCADVTVSLKRVSNPPVAGVDILANIEGDPLGYVAQSPTQGSVYGSGQTWTPRWYFDGPGTYSPFPSVFVSLFGGSGGSTTVENTWVICRTFGS